MAVGTPVITNDTGDICLYLKEGFNGYISNGIETKDIIDVLERIVNSKDTLRQNARNTAENSFDYRNYIELVKSFIETL